MSKNTKVNEKIKAYKFLDDRSVIKGVYIGNLLLLIIFLIANPENLFLNPFARICFITSLIYFLADQFYDWRNPGLNLLLVFVYFFIYLFEIYQYGMPDQIVQLNPDVVSKGIFLELLIIAIPYLYTSIRILLILFLIKMYFTSLKMRTEA